MDEDGKRSLNQFVGGETGTYYMDTDGKMAKDRFVTDETGTYYVGYRRRMINRFATAGDDTFYFGADRRKVVSQFVTDESGTYYVDADGRKGDKPDRQRRERDLLCGCRRQGRDEPVCAPMRKDALLRRGWPPGVQPLDRGGRPSPLCKR